MGVQSCAFMQRIKMEKKEGINLTGKEDKATTILENMAKDNYLEGKENMFRFITLNFL